MIYCFDIDGTICTNTDGAYDQAMPINSRIDHVNKLYESGNTIKFFTARGSTTGICWRKLTEEQLSEWGVRYHELILGKPEAHLFIDDKAINDISYFQYNHPLLASHLEAVKETFDHNFINKLETFANSIFNSLKSGGTIFVAGNGGSFSDAQHFAAELTGRFLVDRKPYAAVVLGSNCSSISAIANDYSYEQVFSRELNGLAQKGDVLLCLSTSGNSPNIVDAANVAKKIGVPSYLFSSKKLSKKYSDLWSESFLVSSTSTCSIQEIHIMMLHMICNKLDEYSA